MASLLNVVATGALVQLGQRHPLKEVQNASQPRRCLFRPGMLMGNVIGIDGDHVGDPDLSGVTVADPRRRFGDEVFGELPFSLCSFARASACADFPAAVPDDPCGWFGSVGSLAGGLEPEARAFASTRHSSLIRSIAASVVKSLPAICSMTSRPRAASRRNPLTVMPPWGNAARTASDNRNGASSSVTNSVSGRAVMMKALAGWALLQLAQSEALGLWPDVRGHRIHRSDGSTACHPNGLSTR